MVGWSPMWFHFGFRVLTYDEPKKARLLCSSSCPEAQGRALRLSLIGPGAGPVIRLLTYKSV